MDGAHALKTDHLTGKTMLNIDSEEEGVFFVSCAGGVGVLCEFDTRWERAAGSALRLEVSGLKGGHSGLEIIQQRANAIKLLGRILDAARSAGAFAIASLSGGSKSNAIAREAQATITAQAPVLAGIQAAVEGLSKELKAEFASADPDFSVSMTAGEQHPRQLDRASTDRIIDFLMAAPNGVQSMSRDLEGLVESSLNLGVLEQSGESIKLIVTIRSCADSIREDLSRRVEILADRVEARHTREGAYPAWQYQADSRIRELCARVYQDVFGSAPRIKAIHAGLECGLLRVKLPQTDMISFGPNLYNVHTPEEHLSIKSVANTWKFLTSVLAQLK